MKELRMNTGVMKSGGKMIKKILFLFLISIYVWTNEKIIIYYGVGPTPNKFYYEFKELTTRKLEISENKLLNYYMIEIENEYLSYEIEIDDYTQIKKMVEKTIKKSELRKCNKIWNTNYGVLKMESIQVLKPIHSEIIIDDSEYCMTGKTPVLQYLNKKYDLKIEWEEIVSE